MSNILTARTIIIKIAVNLSVTLFAGNVFSQTITNTPATKTDNFTRPKLVVGIIVDQMRWDNLYRFSSRYKEDGGFKRLLNGGFNCENTLIPYTPSVTACGHASIYTGSVPAINGITGNEWWDYSINNYMYCTDDTVAKTVGSSTKSGQMSPANLLVNTIGDELRLATNFRSKVIGIALKDRGAILPAGHSANAAYWYDDKTGDWISSTYYMQTLPAWLTELNKKKLTDTFYSQGWKTLYPLETYVQSSTTKKTFDYDLKQYIGKNYGFLRVLPQGNTFTFNIARKVIAEEKLGTDVDTDLLAISLSTPDYIGHTFGPTSVESEDCFLKLDIELGEFLNHLDAKMGKGNYLVFLTSDHGGAQLPSFLKENKIPAGNVDVDKITDSLNKFLAAKYKVDNLVLGLINYQVYFDREAISKSAINKDSVSKQVIEILLKQPGIDRALLIYNIYETALNTNIKNMLINGYYPSRSGDIQMVFKPHWIEGLLKGGTTHGLWNPYDTHVPLLWYGWGISPGKTYREVYITDIAATVAAKLHIQMPSGCVGKVIEEVMR